MPGDTENRKLETILCELEKLDEFSQDTYLKLREFDHKVFGHVFIAVEKERETPSHTATSNFCETTLRRIKRIGETITSISLKLDLMLRELPEGPKTMLTSENIAKLAKLKEGFQQ